MPTDAKGFKKVLAVLTVCIPVLTLLASPSPALAANDPGMPVFGGAANPVPAEPVSYTVNSMMQAMYDTEKGGTDFWMDRMLSRPGSDPEGSDLMTRGRSAYMKVHNPGVLGFAGSFAYQDNLNDRDAYTVAVSPGSFSENVSKRLQTPSYWQSEFNASGVQITQKKFITQNNVFVTLLYITNLHA